MDYHIFFDLDDTLAEVDQPITAETADILRKIEGQGNRIALCSGKPTIYLCAIARQIHLQQPILVGENGLTIQFGVHLPPREYCLLPYDHPNIQYLARLSRRVKAAFGDTIWLQPNTYALTPFFQDDQVRDQLRIFFRENLDNPEILLFEHKDCFDLSPNINKGDAILFLRQELGIGLDKVISVGNGVNDLPMFDQSGASIGINLPEPAKATYHVDGIGKAMSILEKLISQ